MNFYVLVYDRNRRKVITHREFAASEAQRALEERDRLVLANREHSNIEVVLLTAPSYEALRSTHSRYFHFEAVEEIARST